MRFNTVYEYFYILPFILLAGIIASIPVTFIIRKATMIKPDDEPDEEKLPEDLAGSDGLETELHEEGS